MQNENYMLIINLMTTYLPWYIIEQIFELQAIEGAMMPRV